MTTQKVTPGTLPSALEAASPGAVFECDGLFTAPIAINRREDLTFIGGEWTGGVSVQKSKRIHFERPSMRALSIVTADSEDVTVKSGTFRDMRFGPRFSRCHRVAVTDSLFEGLTEDGCRFFEVWGGVFARNVGRGFAPPDGVHPDMVQCASRAWSPPTSDILIEDNDIEGHVQGIGLFNHVRNYEAGRQIWMPDGSYRTLDVDERLNDGGYDRIAIRNNRVRSSRANGIALYEARDAEVSGNHISTLPDPLAWARLTITDCENLLRFGNVVEGYTFPPTAPTNAGRTYAAVIDPDVTPPPPEPEPPPPPVDWQAVAADLEQKLTAAGGRLAIAYSDIAADRAALTTIRSIAVANRTSRKVGPWDQVIAQADAALSSNPAGV
jgi:hypothetical protein